MNEYASCSGCACCPYCGHDSTYDIYNMSAQEADSYYCCEEVYWVNNPSGAPEWWRIHNGGVPGVENRSAAQGGE